MPRIAIDATPLSQRATGAGRVIRNLLAALPAADPGLEYVALATAEGSLSVPAGTRIHVVAPGSGLGWELSGAAKSARDAGADLLFTVRELVGRETPPTVLHLFEPPAYRLRMRAERSVLKDALLSVLVPRSVRRAAAVTAGSATTAGWLHARCGVDATVVLPGLEEAFFEPGDIAARRDPYLFHVAGADPRDRTQLVLAAVALLGGDSPQLVIAGSPDSRRIRIGEEAAKLGIAEKVELLGWVSDEELRALYRGALALVHVPRYEAYGGLPALEAMALGTPVIAFRAPGVSEALEGAALLLDPAEPQALAAAVKRLVMEAELRSSLVAAGRSRVEPLRWERSALQLTEVFHGVLGLPAPSRIASVRSRTDASA